MKYEAIAYGSLSLFTSILHNVFLLYHVEAFLTIFKLDQTSFWIGEAIFLLWNSVNDPLLGWISDRTLILSSSRKRAPSAAASRIESILICGPMLAFSFLLLWVDWGHPLLQFVICLCLYDTFLTVIDLQNSALLVDIADTTSERATYGSYQSVFSASGATSVFLSYLYWDKNNIHAFRAYCMTLASISAVGFIIGTLVLKKQVSGRYVKDKNHNNVSINIGARISYKKFLCQLVSQKNFCIFTIINFIQVLHCHFNSNFFPTFLEVLFTDHTQIASIILGVSFVLPHVTNVFLLWMTKQYGLYTIIKYLFYTKLAVSLCMLSIGMHQSFLLCIFLGVNRVFTEGTCRLLSLAVSDLVDEDRIRHQREASFTASIYGAVNLLGKPGQTFAPIIGTLLLSTFTGTEHSSSAENPLSSGPSMLPNKLVASEGYKLAYFYLAILIPSTCAVLQICFWSFYNLSRKDWIGSAKNFLSSKTLHLV